MPKRKAGGKEASSKEFIYAVTEVRGGNNGVILATDGPRVMIPWDDLPEIMMAFLRAQLFREAESHMPGSSGSKSGPTDEQLLE